MNSDEIGSGLQALQGQLNARVSRRLAEETEKAKQAFKDVFPERPGAKGAQINSWSAPFGENEREQIRGATNSSPLAVLNSLVEIMRSRTTLNGVLREGEKLLQLLEKENETTSGE